jgi:hypothetical protein
MAALLVGAISEMVVGILLIVGPKQHVYLERQSYPVMKASFAQMLGAEFKPDDTLFNAALVSFGSFGIIHGLLIETRGLFALNALRFKVPYDATLKAAITACDPTGIPLPPAARGTTRPHHFELSVNVNVAAPQNAYIQVMYETESAAELPAEVGRRQAGRRRRAQCDGRSSTASPASSAGCRSCRA